MRFGIKDIAYRLMAKRVDEQILEPMHIHIDPEELFYFNLSTNSIMMFRQDNEIYYFRECPEIKPQKDFFMDAVIKFFDTLNSLNINMESFTEEIPISISFSETEILRFKNYIYLRLSDLEFVNTLYKTDSICKKLNFSIWNKQNYPLDFFTNFGMEGIRLELHNIAIYFIWYMRTIAIQFRTLDIVKGEKHSFWNASKNISSKIIADHMGLSDMITNYTWCILHIDGEEKMGLLSETSPGKRMVDIETTLNGSLQRELMNLNALDSVIFQTDHGPNNYTIYISNDKYHVCAFDNDNPNTLFPYPFISKSLAECAPLVKSGIINRPFFDKKLAENIDNINFEILKKDLSNYLNGIQINMLIRRIKNLKKAINNTKKIRNSFLLSESEWNNETVNYELQGTFGKTYLDRTIKR